LILLRIDGFPLIQHSTKNHHSKRRRKSKQKCSA
jgi:hypothetical protein